MLELNNWKSEYAEAFRNLGSLYNFLNLNLSPDLEQVTKTYPIFIPRPLAEKIKKSDALFREFVPSLSEIENPGKGFEDPIGDREYQRAPQLVHRYSSRALFTPTSICPVLCRYCFRKNELSPNDEIFSANFAQTLQYLREHTRISEVIFTGGDPLTLSNEKIDFYLEAFSTISHIKDIRFHTRYPVILPERLDFGFHELIKKYATKFRTLTLAIHANHKDEFDEKSDKAIKALEVLPLQVLSQTVLLKDVNDDPQILRELIEHFLDLKIRPYYLHHPDPVKGATHFMLSLEEGRKIYGSLRTHLPGWAIPQYVIDVPGGEGKIPAFNPEGHPYSGQILNLKGQLLRSPELN